MALLSVPGVPMNLSGRDKMNEGNALTPMSLILMNLILFGSRGIDGFRLQSFRTVCELHFEEGFQIIKVTMGGL